MRLNSLQLMDSDRGLEVHHVVLEAGIDDFVVPVSCVAETLPRVLGHAVKRQNLDPGGRRFLAGQDHASFAGGDVLRDVEAEAPVIAERPGRAPVIFGFNGVGAVFDDLQIVVPGNAAERIHFAGPAREMNGKNRPRPRRNSCLHLQRVNVHRARIDVGQYGRRASMNNRIDRCAERERRRDDLIPGPEILGEHAQMQSGRAGIDRNRLRGAPVPCKIRLELSDLGPGAQPAALHAGDHFLDLRLLDGRSAENQESILGADGIERFHGVGRRRSNK